jgi:hypothetical protein
MSNTTAAAAGGSGGGGVGRSQVKKGLGGSNLEPNQNVSMKMNHGSFGEHCSDASNAGVQLERGGLGRGSNSDGGGGRGAGGRQQGGAEGNRNSSSSSGGGSASDQQQQQQQASLQALQRRRMSQQQQQSKVIKVRNYNIKDDALAATVVGAVRAHVDSS